MNERLIGGRGGGKECGCVSVCGEGGRGEGEEEDERITSEFPVRREKKRTQ